MGGFFVQKAKTELNELADKIAIQNGLSRREALRQLERVLNEIINEELENY